MYWEIRIHGKILAFLFFGKNPETA
jgi:hypothetical protein